MATDRQGPRKDQRQDLGALFETYRATGDRAVRDELAEAHLGLATHLAKRFVGRGEPLDDLIQVASLGLLKAIDRFDHERGIEFSTFAVPTIVGELKRHFRDKGWAVRVPRALQERRLEIGAAAAELTQELGRSPAIAEIAGRIDASEEAVIEAMEAGRAYRGESLDAPIGGDAEMGAALSDRLGEDDANLESLHAFDEARALLDALPPRERTIVVLRFYAGLTQAQIAERVGVSQMHVSRLLSRSLEQLRPLLSADPEADVE